jgi:hypothetical protein
VVADRSARGAKPADVPDRAQHRRGADDVDARHRHRPAHVGAVEGVVGDRPVDRGDLRVGELDVSQARRDRL